ncbi:MFS family permease [Inquilinus ginsengisoli]|uniref:MFS family permease n=1 Tax=Inquilinus ginsengisoli TaxID=363840 RepID=A0ABU1JPZ5_9PROT|nr:MFS transporter [Inquilinus ginsengisoli]MDR6290687.1 MFS family permease [Inquilinus ginsengisoli]
MATLSRDLDSPASSAGSGHDSAVSPGEIAIGVVIGRTAEFFDFFVYAIASVLVFPHFFFPQAQPLDAMLYSFAVFALAFVARPIGSIFFMEVDRRHGRGVKLTMAMFLLGGSTAAMAFLPGTEDIGPAAIALLALFRIGQGLALGGAWDGLASLLALNAPPNRRGWYAMMPQLGAPLGFMLASALFSFFLINLSTADFLDWGWRYPFFVAFAINVVALFARLRLVVTEHFERLYASKDLEAQRVSVTMKQQGANILVGAFVPLATFALFHLVTVFPLSWVSLYTDHNAGDFLMTEFAGAVLGTIGIVASGLIADRTGRRTLLAVCAVLIAIFSFVTPMLLGGGPTARVVFVLVGFALLGLSFGQAAGAVASNFPNRDRYTASALTSDIAWMVGAGFAPFVALALSSRFGLALVGAYLLSGAVCTLAALRVNRELELKQD